MSGSPRHVCLFAQYHPKRRFRAPLLAYLRVLRECGYDVFVASSGEGSPPEEDRAALAGTGAALLCRPNRGLDFGAWQHLIEAGCADGAARVLLANDSVFGPFHPLAPIVARMEGHDVWGMIESRQRAWHLQSWFLQFTGEAFRHEAVRRVFALPFAEMDKEDVIARGELGLGQAFQQAGLHWGAVVRHEDANWFARRHRLNMMHLDWRHNLVALGLPFLKSELLRENPMRLCWTPAWERVLQSMGADPAPIIEYLLDYTGAAPGPHYKVPVKPISIRLFTAFVLATHDRDLALRYIAPRQLRLRMGRHKLGGA